MQDYLANPAKSHQYLEPWDRSILNASAEAEIAKLAQDSRRF